jgi:superfamily II DNA or RNA helicase
MSFSPGNLVTARGRDWVVLPDSSDDFLLLRPLSGGDLEATGIDTELEDVRSATFAWPGPDDVGDYRSARLLRDATRLGFRSSSGPFRCFGRLAFEPRPYQLVPLLMALRQDPVRLLISDDVGIGKTIEAALIARELLDRSEIGKMAVLCPPQLAEQWQKELRTKFHIEAELVLPSTAARLERAVPPGASIFERYPFTVVSTDLIKSDRRRDEFLRTRPEFVVVDEAHTCARSSSTRSNRHQRHKLVSDIAHQGRPDGRVQHLVLVTATPHSGNEEAFRSLLSHLDRSFAGLPDDLSGAHNQSERRRLARHFVQRRRGDIRHYLGSDTDFPRREEAEESYELSPSYRDFFEKVIAFAQETIEASESESRQRQRVRWWSALSLLRCVGSSPAAAAATLRSRASSVGSQTAEQVDEAGRRYTLDVEYDEDDEDADNVHGANFAADEDEERRLKHRLQELAKQADALHGDHDEKLQRIIAVTRDLLRDGFSPIIFCRFIPTAIYLAEALGDALRGVTVKAITGKDSPSEREVLVDQLGQEEKRVLVATDCLSEGINLQHYCDAVVHYDLSWNPTRHEQRDGRVDRYGQPSPSVRVMSYFGQDNKIDGIVLDVLINKHKKIRSALGIAIPVPMDTDAVMEALYEGLLLRGASKDSRQLLLFEELWHKKRREVHAQWDDVTDREKRSRTVFAQEGIRPEEIQPELEAMRKAVGLGVDIGRFVADAVTLSEGVARTRDDGRIDIDVTECPRPLRDAVRIADGDGRLRFVVDGPARRGEIPLVRTHPFVEGLASHVLDAAVDGTGVARRAGVVRTREVDRRTTALVLRLRYHITQRAGNEEHPMLAEEVQTLAFAGSPDAPEWLTEDEANRLLEMRPTANILPEQAKLHIERLVGGSGELTDHLARLAHERAEVLLTAHQRVRQVSRTSGSETIEPQLPVDVLGAYIYLPE